MVVDSITTPCPAASLIVHSALVQTQGLLVRQRSPAATCSNVHSRCCDTGPLKRPPEDRSNELAVGDHIVTGKQRPFCKDSLILLAAGEILAFLSDPGLHLRSCVVLAVSN